jgi:hypothetical protein
MRRGFSGIAGVVEGAVRAARGLVGIAIEFSQMRKRIWLVVTFMLIAVAAGVGYEVYVFFHPSFGLVGEFQSPDQRFRCLVYKCPPPGFYFSPYRYRFELTDAAGRGLAGDSLKLSTDSASLSNFKARWDVGRVTVRSESGQAATCDFGDGKQQWDYINQSSAFAQ